MRKDLVSTYSVSNECAGRRTPMIRVRRRSKLLTMGFRHTASRQLEYDVTSVMIPLSGTFTATTAANLLRSSIDHGQIADSTN